MGVKASVNLLREACRECKLFPLLRVVRVDTYKFAVPYCEISCEIAVRNDLIKRRQITRNERSEKRPISPS